MFVKVYLSALFVLLCASGIGFGVYQLLNEWRETQYEERLVFGMLRVARDGYERQSPEKRSGWLSLVSELTGTPFKIVSEPSAYEGDDAYLVRDLSEGMGFFSTTQRQRQ